MTLATVKQLWTHPIKGLTPHAQDRVVLQEGHGIPGDRAFALLFETDSIEPLVDVVPWMRKQHFAVQCDWPGLAALDCRYDPDTTALQISRQGVELLSVLTNTHTGRQQLNTFFTGYVAALTPTATARHPDRAPLRLVGAPDETRYPDREIAHLSLVSQATLDQMSEWMNQPIDVRRFRPNVVLEGVSAWEELTWVGREFMLGTARIQITAPINRCLNIDVNPETGDRDLPLFDALQPHMGHRQTGVLAVIVEGGTVSLGETLAIAE